MSALSREGDAMNLPSLLTALAILFLARLVWHRRGHRRTVRLATPPRVTPEALFALARRTTERLEHERRREQAGR